MYPSVEVPPGPSQVTKINIFARTFNVFESMLLTIFVKITTMDVWRPLIVTSDQFRTLAINSFFYDGGPYHIETSLLIYRANQWTIFYMIGTSVMKELNVSQSMSE